ncbi:MAG TPA: DUF983 domain-containing protein [Steroidobacteraceae bacterium]|nr:DUF983 domain-containing protein [Steroidobacteraceae bacterium]
MQTARRPRFRSVVRDALRLRCPNCQQGPVLARWPNKIFPECASCGLSFFREQGYYIGGMMITYGLTLAVVIPVFLVSLVLPDLRIVSENARFALWVLFAVPLSFLLMPCAYSLWLHLDFWLEPWKPPQRS